MALKGTIRLYYYNLTFSIHNPLHPTYKSTPSQTEFFMTWGEVDISAYHLVFRTLALQNLYTWYFVSRMFRPKRHLETDQIDVSYSATLRKGAICEHHVHNYWSTTKCILLTYFCKMRETPQPAYDLSASSTVWRQSWMYMKHPKWLVSSRAVVTLQRRITRKHDK